MLSSCFDVVEEVGMKTNGSGSIKLIVNLSKSKTKVASLMKLDKIDGIKIPSEKEIRADVQEVATILKSTNGISNVKYTLDFTNYIANLSCDFSNIEALNSFTKALSTKFKTELTQYSKYSYAPKTKTLTRTYVYNGDGKKTLGSLKMENQKAIQDASFASIYRFDDTIRKQDNANAKVSSNKKAVMLRVSILDIVNGKVNLSNNISLD